MAFAMGVLLLMMMMMAVNMVLLLADPCSSWLVDPVVVAIVCVLFAHVSSCLGPQFQHWMTATWCS